MFNKNEIFCLLSPQDIVLIMVCMFLWNVCRVFHTTQGVHDQALFFLFRQKITRSTMKLPYLPHWRPPVHAMLRMSTIRDILCSGQLHRIYHIEEILIFVLRRTSWSLWPVNKKDFFFIHSLWCCSFCEIIVTC